MVKLLIDKGVDVMSIDTVGNTLLHYAAEKGKLDVVKMLINHKADVNATNRLGDTPLLNAVQAQGEHRDVAEYLAVVRRLRMKLYRILVNRFGICVKS